MTTIKVLVVTITNHLSVSDHVRDVISKCSQTRALKVLRCHGMNDKASQQVYKAVVIAKLLYASLAWWSIRRQQTKSVLRRLFDEEFDSDCTRLTTTQLADNNDDNLFSSLLTNGNHVTAASWLDKLSIGYNEWMNEWLTLFRHSEVRTSRQQQSIVAMPTQINLWN